MSDRFNDKHAPSRPPAPHPQVRRAANNIGVITIDFDKNVQPSPNFLQNKLLLKSSV